MKTNRLLSIFSVIFCVLILFSCMSERDAVTKGVPIAYTNPQGKEFLEIAIPGQAIITFGNTDEEQQLKIIKDCGGKVIEHYPMLRTYLVKTGENKEMEFILKARQQPGVESATLNVVSEPMGVNMNIIDDFTHVSNGLIHGEYCVESAKSAFPSNPGFLLINPYDLQGHFTRSEELKCLNHIFGTTHPDSLILLNISYGPRIYELERVSSNNAGNAVVQDSNGNYYQYVIGKNGKPVEIDWDETYAHANGDLERQLWIDRYLEGINERTADLTTVSEVSGNTNYIVFKSSGNVGCHVADSVIFNQNVLNAILSQRQLTTLENHMFHVSAKDDDRRTNQNVLYADYAVSPVQYNPYMSMVDISHLKHDGTSFSTPLLLGLAAKRFYINGYRPESQPKGSGISVSEMVRHIKNVTRNYALNVQQPGLYTEDGDSTSYTTGPYYYNHRYAFTGVLKRGYEDLCGTGVPEEYFFLEIGPIDIDVDGSSEFEEPLRGVTQLQLVNAGNNNIYNSPGNRSTGNNDDLASLVGQVVTATGTLRYHIAGCHIHTDAYLEDYVINEAQIIDCPEDETPRTIISPTFNDTSSGHFSIKSITLSDDFTVIECSYTSAPGDDSMNLRSDTFIKIPAGIEYRLMNSKGIALFPDKTYFSGVNETKNFTLIFPPIPVCTTSIDLIEPNTDWQFTNIRL